MKPRERRALGVYVREVADQIGLRDWTFHLERDPLQSDSGALATVTAVDGRRVATIQFCRQFRDLKRDEQRSTVVHELVHCHLAPVQHQVEGDLERVLGMQSDRLLFDSFRRNLEYSVDAIATALADHLPLIDWTDS